MDAREYSGDAVIKVGDDIVRRREWRGLDCMKTGQATGWLRRGFNAALRTAPRDVIVTGGLCLRLSGPPYTSIDGELGGVNGQTLRQKGIFD